MTKPAPPAYLAGFPDLHVRADPEAEPIIDTVAERVISALPGRSGRRKPPLPRRTELLPAVLGELAKDVSAPSIIKDVRDFLLAGQEIDAVLAAEHERVQRAQNFFDDNGVVIITALFHASLPEAYLGKRGVQVLDITGELSRNWTRRAQETGQFLINVLSPTPGLWRDKKTTSLTAAQFAAVNCRRVRLVHAAIRWMVEDLAQHELTRPTTQASPVALSIWDERLNEIGLGAGSSKPLNQEDLLATLGTFTTVVFDALDRFGISYTEDDRTAFYFLWNIVGWHLGIGDEQAVPAPPNAFPGRFPGNRLLPLSDAELDSTYRHLAAELQQPTHQGRRMTKVLLQELAYPLPDRLRGAPAFIARYLLSEQHANDLGIERGGYTELVLNSTGLLLSWSRIARLNGVSRAGIGLLSQYVTQFAVRAFISQARWSERGLKIDPRVASRWGIELPPKTADLAPT
jgi:ER-bound oxygenase mpaB/B'/Rubber oxygenase, catalytic domain